MRRKKQKNLPRGSWGGKDSGNEHGNTRKITPLIKTLKETESKELEKYKERFGDLI